VNRNIITAADAERLRKNFVASLGDRGFGERMLGEPGVYLGLDRALKSANIGNQGLVIWLGVALVITVLFNVLYLRRKEEAL
jgi:hypothetical protein